MSYQDQDDYVNQILRQSQLTRDLAQKQGEEIQNHLSSTSINKYFNGMVSQQLEKNNYEQQQHKNLFTSDHLLEYLTPTNRQSQERNVDHLLDIFKQSPQNVQNGHVEEEDSQASQEDLQEDFNKAKQWRNYYKRKLTDNKIENQRLQSDNDYLNIKYKEMEKNIQFLQEDLQALKEEEQEIENDVSQGDYDKLMVVQQHQDQLVEMRKLHDQREHELLRLQEQTYQKSLENNDVNNNKSVESEELYDENTRLKKILNRKKEDLQNQKNIIQNIESECQHLITENDTMKSVLRKKKGGCC